MGSRVQARKIERSSRGDSNATKDNSSARSLGFTRKRGTSRARERARSSLSQIWSSSGLRSRSRSRSSKHKGNGSNEANKGRNVNHCEDKFYAKNEQAVRSWIKGLKEGLSECSGEEILALSQEAAGRPASLIQPGPPRPPQLSKQQASHPRLQGPVPLGQGLASVADLPPTRSITL